MLKAISLRVVKAFFVLAACYYCLLVVGTFMPIIVWLFDWLGFIND